MKPWLLVGRRTIALALPALVAAGLITIFVNNTRWIGSWRMALDWATGSLVLIGPVAAGWAALTYAGLAQHGWHRFAAATIRSGRALLDPLLTIWIVAVAALLITTTTTLTISSLAGSRATPADLWVLGEAAAVLAAQVSIGAAIGLASRGLWAAPVAAVGVFALAPISALGHLGGVFDTGSVTGSLVGQTWSVQTLGWQSATALGLAGLLTCGLVLSVAAGARGLVLALAGISAVALAGGWAVLDQSGRERYAVDSAPPSWICRVGTPQVCMDASTTRPLDSVAAEMQRQAAPLIAAGVAVPVRFDQEVPARPPVRKHGVLLFVSSSETAASADPQSVALSLATPRPCAEYAAASSPTRALRAHVVLADWIAVRAGVHGAEARLGSAEERWLSGPLAEQQRWVVETYEQLANCDFGPIDVPF
jgi:hypothetical protein